MYEPATSQSRAVLQKSALQGGIAVAGGVALLIASALTNAPIIGIIAGIAVGAYGFSMIKSNTARKPGETTVGAIITAVGIITAVSSIGILGGFGGFVLGAAGVSLLAFGGWKLFKFWKGMKRQSS